MIEADKLGKQFESFTAVHELSLHVPDGQLLALLGPNGAGKTTTVRMLSAILRPSQGWAKINGYDVVRQADQVRRTIGVLTEQPGLYGRMNGLEYLQFYGRLYGLPDAHTRAKSVAMFKQFYMEGAESRRLGSYSKGMRQKVGLIRALLHDPAVLLLDEPTSAMDPHSAKLVRDAIVGLRDNQRTIILCTHNLAEAEQLADKIAIIKQGRILAQGTFAELKQQLLGQPQMELRLDKPVDGRLPGLEQLVSVESVAGSVIRYRTADPLTVNPQLVAHLQSLGLGIVTLQEVGQSLEALYLSVMNEQTNREGDTV